jgi:SAM-dependent MidA family methyltransferase
VDDNLGARLRRRIEASGPITFAAFMETALYDPDGGFFEGGGPAVGAEGDFVTSPHVSPLFGSLLAGLVEHVRERAGDPPVLSVMEVGAGDGTLARDLAAALARPDRTELVLVERSAAQRARLQAALPELPCPVRLARSVSELAPGSVVGLILANELLDNLPFHRIRRHTSGTRELWVGVEDERLVLVEGDPSSAAVAEGGERLAVDGDGVVPAGALSFLDDAAAILERGYLVLIDYAAAADAEVHGYRGHRPVADVLAAPGMTDVTAGVDFELLAAHAQALGLRSWGTVSQRDLLLSLGYGAEADRLRDRQARLLNEGHGTEAARLFSDRNRAGLLVDPAGLGAFRALCLAKDADDPLPPWRG